MGGADAPGRRWRVKGWGMGAALAIREQADAARRRAQQRRRQAGRYALEIEAARARGWVETAAAIEAERAEWLATADDN